MGYARNNYVVAMAVLVGLQLLPESVVAFSTPSVAISVVRPMSTIFSTTALPYKNSKDGNDDDDFFPDPHALMDYLDGPSEQIGFLSFEEYQELQRKQQYLGACPMFRECSSDDLSRIAKTMVLQDVGEGEKLVVQGESGDAMYFLKSGSLQAIGEEPVSLEGATSNETTATTTTKTTIYTTYSKEGSFFGELALLFGQTRAASIVATKPSQVYRLDKTAFLESIVDSPVYETAKRIILSKYQSKRIRDILPKIRVDELLGLVKARLFTSRNKDLKRWLTTFRTFALGACATVIMANIQVKTAVLRPLVFASIALVAHML